MEWTFTAEVVEWRGPSPYYFLPMSASDSAEFKQSAAGLEYWGQVAVEVEIGDTRFSSAVYPRDGLYQVPLRAAVRVAEGLEIGMPVTATVRIRQNRTR